MTHRRFSAASAILLYCLSLPAAAVEVVVLSDLDTTINWLESEAWWGEAKRAQQLSVPRALITSTGPNWRETSKNIPVAQKKEVFYRFLLPLILHANEMVMDRRARLEAMAEQLHGGVALAPDDLAWLADVARLLRIAHSDGSASLGDSPAEVIKVINEALYKLDEVPAGLALGQAAYESGYGTSRFAAEGNALFGQWTFGGEGLVPAKQRGELGDHRIAAFDWPFDSVRGYFINLSSHPAYEPFRKLRAEQRRLGQPLDSVALANGLIRYSERGQQYVDTLQGIIRFNNLSIADTARFRDEPMRFIVIASGENEALELQEKIAQGQKSGELERIVARMQLD